MVKVRDAIKLIEEDGWFLVRTRGSHRQYKHSTKKGLVTIAGKRNDELARGTLNSILKTGWIERMKKYLIIIEKTDTGFSAYSPDLPGCVATGHSKEETEERMREAIQFHLDGLRTEGLAIPDPQSSSAYVEIAA